MFIRNSVSTLLTALALAMSLPSYDAGAQTVINSLHKVTGDPLAPDYCGIDFTYKDNEALYPEEGGGVAAADFDNDGKIDLFFANNKGGANRLYRNLGDATFVDEAVARGVSDVNSAGSMGLFIDYDCDGDLDLVVICHLAKPGGPSLGPKFKLFRNTGAAGGYTFVDVTSQAGFALLPTPKGTAVGWVGGACSGDFNRDGYPDIFADWYAAGTHPDQWRLLRSAPNPVPGNPSDPDYSPRVYLDATPGSGLQVVYPGEAWQPMFVDANRDGWPDLALNIDFDLDLYFLNNQDGTFTQQATAMGLNGDPIQLKNQMGQTWGDTDNDGDMDNHRTNRTNLDDFFRNDCDGNDLHFVNIADETGLDNTVFGWGDLFFDFDNDGDLDHTSQGGYEHLPPVDWTNTVHLNLFPQTLPSGNGAWADVSSQLVEYTYFGLPAGDLSRGLSQADLDNDGDLDLIVTHNNEPAAVYINTLGRTLHGWLELDLVESGEALPNAKAFKPAEPHVTLTRTSLNITGTQVWTRVGNVTQYREVYTGSSFWCQEQPRVHFGLGPDAASTYKWTVVRWFDGSYQILGDLTLNAINRRQHLGYDDSGDLDGDGHLTSQDQVMLALLISDKAAFLAAYPDAPGLVTGDIDGNNVLDASDLALWSDLPPH